MNLLRRLETMLVLLSRSYAVMSHFDGLSRREIIGWAVCLVLAVGLTLFGSAYLAGSFMSADVSGVLKSPDGTKHGTAASVALTRPEEHLPPRRRHAHALFPIGDGPVLSHPRPASSPPPVPGLICQT
jgi:hypothetical protein